MTTEKATQAGRESNETSQYVTVFHQLKETEQAEPGDRFISHGEAFDDRYQLDEEKEGFVPLARPIAVIDAGVEMTKDDMGDWCNSHAGKAVLNQYFPKVEPEDPTLQDCEEYLEPAAANTTESDAGEE